MAKKDGLKIAIEFTEEIVGGVSDSASAFTVTIQRYTYVPGGTLISETRTVTSLELDENDAHILYLNFGAGNTRSIQNARNTIQIEYDATKGRLRGEGAPVQSFMESFTPTDLEPKDNPADLEHLEMTVTASGTLTRIYYSSAKAADEHLEMSVTATGTLIYVGDL